jgi:hypothetical protein
MAVEVAIARPGTEIEARDWILTRQVEEKVEITRQGGYEAKADNEEARRMTRLAYGVMSEAEELNEEAESRGPSWARY